jgi:hypothetical protein
MYNKIKTVTTVKVVSDPDEPDNPPKKSGWSVTKLFTSGVEFLCKIFKSYQ